jgi:hypothetical protein
MIQNKLDVFTQDKLIDPKKSQQQEQEEIKDKISNGSNSLRYGVCKICLRPIWNTKSVQRSIGPICYGKYQSAWKMNEKILESLQEDPSWTKLDPTRYADYYHKWQSEKRVCPDCKTDLKNEPIFYNRVSSLDAVKLYPKVKFRSLIYVRCPHCRKVANVIDLNWRPDHE